METPALLQCEAINIDEFHFSVTIDNKELESEEICNVKTGFCLCGK